MHEMNNLMKSCNGFPSDEEILRNAGTILSEYKSASDSYVWEYMIGMLMMSMHDLGHADKAIQEVIDEMATHFWHDDVGDVLIWEHTHDLDI